MTIKQKFERIDQSKLEPNQVKALNVVVEFTENFKTTDKEKIKITDDKLDAIIVKLQEKNPNALKPIASTKKASSTKAPKRNVFSVAKEIQKAGETFEEAKKRAVQQMNDEKTAINKVVKSEMKSLLEYIKTHKELEGIHGTDLPRDSTRVAKIAGRRISKNGNVYYERRENRMDRLAPNYPKDAPLLADGGDFKVGYKGTIINDSIDYIVKQLPYKYQIKNDSLGLSVFSTQDGLVSLKNLLHFRYNVDSSFESSKKIGLKELNIPSGQVVGMLESGAYLTDPTFGNFQTQVFKKGGLLTAKERYFLEIKGQTGLRIDAIEKYTEDNNLSDNDVLNIVVGLGRKQLKGADVSTAIVGKKDNSESKKLIAFVKDNKAMKMENGGAFNLAGQLNGTLNLGQNQGDLSGTSGTQYSGLVGETGAMSAGEMFEKGGSIPNNYKDKSADEVWGNWNYDQKYHFLSDHREKIGFEEDLYNELKRTTRPKKSSKGTDIGFMYIDIDKIINTKYTELPKYVKFALLDHVRTGQYAIGGGVGFTDKRKEYLGNLGDLEAEVWDKIGANSGREIRGDKALLKKYAQGVEKIMETDGIGHGSFDQDDYDYFTDQNFHLFNEFLVWNNYYEPEMTKVEKAWRRKDFKAKSNYISDPEVITLNQTKRSNSGGFKVGDVVAHKTNRTIGIVRNVFEDYKGDLRTSADGVVSIDELEIYDPKKHKDYHIAPSLKKELGITTSKKYVPHYEIASVTVKKDGKEVTYKGSDVLNGANELKKGGDISKLGTYIAKRYIVCVKLKNGEEIHPANGYWIAKKAPKMSRTQFEEGSYEYAEGGEVKEATINKDGIKVKSVAMPKKSLSEAEWLAKHNESMEARTYKAGGSLKGYSEFVQEEFPKMKRLANKYSKESKEAYLVLTEEGKENPNLSIKPASYFYTFPKSYRDEFEILYLTSEKFNEGGSLDNLPKQGDVIDNIGKYGARIDKVTDKFVTWKGDRAQEEYCKISDLKLNNLDDDGDDDGYYEDDDNHWITAKPQGYLKGGKVTFDEKSHAIAERLEYQKVEPKYQKEYGKVYSEEEAEKAGDRIAGSMIKKEKMSKGAVVKKGSGSPKMKIAIEFAKSTRKAGESWQSALKRGWEHVK